MKLNPASLWFLSCIVLQSWLTPKIALAQVIPDGTTPTNTGICGTVCTITGGTTRGSNLFHSFQDLNVNEGQQVRFANPVGIANILSRVTGNNVSNIRGTLGVDGTANLFLLNPNGIVFGPNARLDVRGSFLASTADRFIFTDGSEFSAVNPQAPPLLAINVPVGLQYGTQPGAIRSQATLAVDPGQRLTLAGGTIQIDGGRLVAPGGRIELGAIGGAGTVALGNGFDLSLPPSLARADMALTNAAEVSVRGETAGDIAIATANLDLLGGSRIRAGIAETSVGSQAGDIYLEATGAVRIGEGSGISNAVLEFATGNGGDIVISADSLTLSNGSFVSASVLDFAQGNVGDIVINTNSLTVTGDSLIAASVFGSQGNGGNIAIATGSLFIADRSFVSADAFPNATEASPDPKNAGTVTIQATDAVRLLNLSEISALSNLGRGGDISITTRRLFASSSNLDSYGSGADAGDITIRAADSITLVDPRNLPLRGSRIGAFTSGSSGQAGRIVLETGDLTAQDYNILSTSGLAGGIGARSGSIVVRATGDVDLNNSDLSVISLRDGRGGNIAIESNRLTVQNLSLVGASALDTGSSGNIDITTGQLRVLSGGQIVTQTASVNRGGDLTIRASDLVEVTGNRVEVAPELVDQPTSFFSRIGTDSIGAGDAGNLSIETRRLLIRNGAQVGASTFRAGRGGTITVNASEQIDIAGVIEAIGISSSGYLPSNLSTFASGSGDAGDIFVNTGRLRVRDGGLVLARTFGTGQGGQMIINATNGVEIIGFSPQTRLPSSLLVDTSGSGEAGVLTMNTDRLSLRAGGRISAQTLASGQGGTINLTISDLTEVTGTSEDSSFRSAIEVGTDRGTGAGGSLAIATGRLRVRNGGLITVGTFGTGNAGELDITADVVDVAGTSANGQFPSSIAAEVGRDASGNGGDVAIATGRLTVRDGGIVAVSTFGAGDAGALAIRANETVDVVGSSINGRSSISAGTGSNARGRGGDVFIRTRQLTVQDDAQVTVSSPNGQAGNLTIAANTVRLNRGRLTAETGRSGNGAAANIAMQEVGLLVMSDRSLISAEANGTANGGNITLAAPEGFIVATPGDAPGSDIIANADRGNGGNINITTQRLFGIEFRDRLTLDNDITASSRVGVAGTVAINTPDIDPSRGLTELPTNLADASTQISRGCSASAIANNNADSFLITGRGGLPSNPNDTLDSEDVLVEWVSESSTAEGGENHSTHTPYTPIVEAQGWAIASNGDVMLTTQASEISHRAWQNSIC
ncbi:filamentous hemagglutinin N-terminal domain-containing protein [Oscillatoria sp. FACHB-1407]|uniref:two-partner secretion domain-containing protein n=1 Tax=Oscillatoria sp. FACHB-1407 TaxID=2692847 RepID=UPI00168219B7|nr:filamentous hemagglutinin N-terminal domain-containing protein [Oscillatoria sp. FACHB-1407]MBD2464378.1 filamentous hemagglutinin N-terminal domain-containing protein [Oscillatoria sp. FACHB-1407]